MRTTVLSESTLGFQSAGKTSRLSASAGSARVALSAICTGPIAQVMVINNTTSLAYVAWGDSTVVASAGSLGTATSDEPVQAGACVVFTVPDGVAFAAAILESSTGELTFTPGIGE